ncbi:ADOP family duplicated permease [Silvibacterium acidisoli]|uniref:ADOP family duplicated permease n=1 Tax=Acidobacteriaceae bacterium ZG23-2 TaxID=2883246 RepID=UPI00406C8F89
MLSDLRYRLRSLFLRSHVEAELDEELQAHLEHETEKYIRAGMSPEEAKRKARIAFGGPEQIRQQVRDNRGTRLLENFLQDLRYGTRSLLRNRGFAIVVVMTLALGIAACTAVFSLMDVVLYPKLPYTNPDRLVYLFTPNSLFESVPPDAIPPSFFFAQGIQKSSRLYASFTEFQQLSFNLERKGSVVPVEGATVDASFFSTLGVAPILGRAIGQQDDQAGKRDTAVISYALWKQQFGGDPHIIGQQMTLKVYRQMPEAQNRAANNSYRIIGVMPQGFHYPHKQELDYGVSGAEATDVWVPLALTPAQRMNDEPGDSYSLARLKDGVTVQQAQAEMSAIVAQLNKIEPPSAMFHGGWRAYIKPFRQTLVGDARPLLRLLMGAVGFVLLIACGNASSLLLARNASRTHELGVRATLGAGRARLIQQMLTDALLLSLTAGAVSTALAWLFLKMLLRLDPGNVPRLQQVSMNPHVLLFTLSVTLLTSVATGILPALSSSRGDLVEFLKSGGNKGVVRGNNRLRGVLIAGEVALVVMLLSGASLLIRSFLKVEAVPTGFSTATLSMKVDLPPAYATAAQHRGLFPRLLDDIRAIPGVQAAGAITNLPLSHDESITTLWVQDYANEKGQTVEAASLTAGYFGAMGTPMLAGREFRLNEGNVVIVNEAFVRKYFAGKNAIGKWIANGTPDNRNSNKRVIIGVVADVRHSSLEEPPPPTLYDCLQDPDRAYLAIRSSVPPAEVVPAVRAALNKLDPTLTLADIHTMNDRVSEALALRRFQTVLLGAFSVMALALALVGLYGLLAYTVRQREQEIGIRLAIGASRGNVLSLIVSQGVRLVFAGLLLGIAGAFALQHLIRSFLFGVNATDPVTFLLVPVLLLLTALGACVIPGWRAANVDPADSLRYE